METPSQPPPSYGSIEHTPIGQHIQSIQPANIQPANIQPKSRDMIKNPLALKIVVFIVLTALTLTAMLWGYSKSVDKHSASFVVPLSISIVLIIVSSITHHYEKYYESTIILIVSFMLIQSSLIVAHWQKIDNSDNEGDEEYSTKQNISTIYFAILSLVHVGLIIQSVQSAKKCTTTCS